MGKPITVGFATAKAAQRMLTQSLARDLGPKGIHCFYSIIDGRIGAESGDEGENGSRLDPDGIADNYWYVAQQKRKNWTAGPGLKIGDLQNKISKYTDISDITNT